MTFTEIDEIRKLIKPHTYDIKSLHSQRHTEKFSMVKLTMRSKLTTNKPKTKHVTRFTAKRIENECVKTDK